MSLEAKSIDSPHPLIVTENNLRDDLERSLVTEETALSSQSAPSNVRQESTEEVNENLRCQCPLCVLIILSIILPPLAVGIKCGCCTRAWIISFLLMFVGFIPGVVFALLVVTDHTPFTKGRILDERNQRQGTESRV